MLKRANEIRKTKSFADLFVLTSIMLGWLILVFLGLKEQFGIIWACLALVLMFCANSMVVVLVACGFACWGAYAALHLHWALSALLGIPLFPALIAGLVMNALKTLLGLAFKKADKED